MNHLAVHLKLTEHTKSTILQFVEKVHIEALTGFGHVVHGLDDPNALLSQGCVLETVPSVGMVGRRYIPR